MSDYDACRRVMEALEDAYRSAFAQAREGMTAEEIDATLLAVLEPRGIGLPKSSITPYVVGPEGHPPKQRINRAPLQRGALWGMDCNANGGGAWADIGRYGFIGPPDATVLRDYQEVLDLADFMAAQVRPGRPIEDMFAAIPGDLPYEIHRIGEQQTMMPVFGTAVPRLAEKLARCKAEGLTFQVGQVVCVEIWAGLRGGIEDMYVVDAHGLVRMSTLPRGIRMTQ